MGTHFGAVSLCVANTSLSHALLVINVAPLFLVAGITMLWILNSFALKSCHHTDERSWAARLESVLPALPPTAMEAVGAVTAFSGVTALVLSASSGRGDEARASWVGDVIGLYASASLSIYWYVTSRVRTWCPLFAWLCPLNGAAALTCALVSLAVVPGTTWSAVETPTGVFSWIGGGTIFTFSFCNALFASCLGHGLAAFVIGRAGSLPVSTSMLSQPPSGTLIGYIAGVQGPPGLSVLACAPIILSGAYLVIVGGRDKGLTWADAMRCRLKQQAAAQPLAKEVEAEEGAGKQDWRPLALPTPSATLTPSAVSSAGGVEEWGEPHTHIPRIVGPAGQAGRPP